MIGFIVNNFNKTLKNGFLRVSGTNGVITLLKTLVTLFSNKIIATVIGTAGLGVVGQLQSIMTITMLLSSAGFNQGVTKYIAENNNKKDIVDSFISTAFFTTVLSSTIAGILTFLFANTISIYVFDNLKYVSIIVFFSFSLILYNINNLLIASVNGFKLFKKYFTINIITTFVGIILSVGLVLLLKEYGAMLAIILSQSIICFITIFLLRKEDWIKSISLSLFDKRKLKLLLSYSIITYFSSLLWPLAQIFIRSYVIKYISPEEAGIWEATRRINDYIVNLAIGSFSVYLLPVLSEIKDKKALKNELINIYKIIIPIVSVSFLVFYEFRLFFIDMLYSKDFTKVSDYIGLQMFGSFFWMCKVVPMNLMLAKGKLKLYMIYEIASWVIYVSVVIVLIPTYGVQGIQVAFAVYNFIQLIVTAYSMKYCI
ncbi:O-antigen translocase [Spirosoma pulveris]